MTTDIHRPQTPATVILAEAVNAVIKSFAKHSTNGTVVASDALQEFWDMKWTKTADAKPVAPILYENKQELYNGKNCYICYVTLPGGSCYGSSTPCQTENLAKESAAKVALMNSVFNEHPSRQINMELIDKILSSVASGNSSAGQKKFQNCMGAFRSMLLASRGKSLLVFQEMMIIFQLLHWNGNLKEMKRRKCSREEVISRYAGSTMDQRMRDGMVRDWKSRELKLPGVVNTELSMSEESMRRCREVGTDLRFHKEKRDILIRVLSELSPSNVNLSKDKFVGAKKIGSTMGDVVEDDINITI